MATTEKAPAKKAATPKTVSPAVKARHARAAKRIDAQAAKKTPAKKTAAAPAPRVDYKPGTRVKVQRVGKDKKITEAKGHVATSKEFPDHPGFPAGVKETGTGKFILINIGTKDVPIPIEARPARVRGY